jgi:hypothetical protein
MTKQSNCIGRSQGTPVRAEQAEGAGISMLSGELRL